MNFVIDKTDNFKCLLSKFQGYIGPHKIISSNKVYLIEALFERATGL